MEIQIFVVKVLQAQMFTEEEKKDELLKENT